MSDEPSQPLWVAGPHVLSVPHLPLSEETRSPFLVVLFLLPLSACVCVHVLIHIRNSTNAAVLRVHVYGTHPPTEPDRLRSDALHPQTVE